MHYSRWGAGGRFRLILYSPCYCRFNLCSSGISDGHEGSAGDAKSSAKASVACGRPRQRSVFCAHTHTACGPMPQCPLTAYWAWQSCPRMAVAMTGSQKSLHSIEEEEERNEYIILPSKEDPVYIKGQTLCFSLNSYDPLYKLHPILIYKARYKQMFS